MWKECVDKGTIRRGQALFSARAAPLSKGSSQVPFEKSYYHLMRKNENKIHKRHNERNVWKLKPVFSLKLAKLSLNDYSILLNLSSI